MYVAINILYYFEYVPYKTTVPNPALPTKTAPRPQWLAPEYLRQ